MKGVKTWWLSESRQVLQIFTVILLLLTLILVPWLFIYGGHQEHEPTTFVSVNTSMPEGHTSEPEVAPECAASPTTLQDPAPSTGCLAMIMKDEGPILHRLFESVREFVSEYCVVDTGSTDDTIDVLKSMEMPGMPKYLTDIESRSGSITSPSTALPSKQRLLLIEGSSGAWRGSHSKFADYLDSACAQMRPKRSLGAYHS